MNVFIVFSKIMSILRNLSVQLFGTNCPTRAIGGARPYRWLFGSGQTCTCTTLLFAKSFQIGLVQAFAFKFFSLLFSHTSLRTFLGFRPLDEAGSSLSLSSDDMKSMAFGEQKISLAFSLSLSDKIAFSKLERRLDSF